MRGADFTRAALHRRFWTDLDIADLLGPADWRGPCAVTRKTLEYWDNERVVGAERDEPVFAKRRDAKANGEAWKCIKRTPSLLTAPQLMRRGWRAYDIRRHLGATDGKVGGYDAYRLERVERAEMADAALRAAVARNQPWGLR